MRTHVLALTCLASVMASALATAQDAPDLGVGTERPPDPAVASAPAFAGTRLAVELMEPLGTTRGQLLTRGLFSDGDAVFTSETAWTAEGRFHFALTPNFGLTGALPFGFVSRAARKRVFIGNVMVGGAGGTHIDLVDPVSSPTPIRLRLGGGIEAYLPTAPSSNATTLAGVSLAAAMRGYEPQLFVPDLFSGRVRGQLSLSVGDLTAQAELSLVSGATIRGKTEGVFLIGGAMRASYLVTPLVEPFLELAGTTQVAGTGQIRPPFMITPGVRLHITPNFSPAVFLSANFVAAKALMFGIDLAAMATNLPSPKRRAVADEPDDFLGDDF